MSNPLRLVEGRLSALRYLERPDQDDHENSARQSEEEEPAVKSRGYWFSHRVVPLLAALTGNGGVATGLAFQQSNQDDVLAKLNAEADKVEHPETWSYANFRGSKTYRSRNSFVTIGKNGKIISGKFPVEIEIGGERYRGFLGGQCFRDGDDITAVLNQKNRLIAISSADRRYIVMDYLCGNTAFLGLAKTNLRVWKWCFVAINCLAIPMMLLSIGISAGGFSDWKVAIFMLLAMPIGMGVLLALILVFKLSWSDWLPSWRTSSILHALGRPDLCDRDFDDARVNAEHDGRARETDIGQIFYV